MADAVDFVDDWIAFPHAAALVESVPPALAEAGMPGVEFAGVLPGNTVAIDYVTGQSGAMAWARVANVFPSMSFPTQDYTVEKVIVLATQVEFGILRAAVMPDTGEAPTPEEQFEMARLQLADMRLLLQLACAYAGDDIPMLLGNYTPTGPEGGVVGGAWLVTFGGV